MDTDPEKFASGVNVTVEPSVVAVPFPLATAVKTDNVSPSASVSFDSAFIVTAVSSAVVTLSSFATGAAAETGPTKNKAQILATENNT